MKEDEVNREVLREVLTKYVRLDERGNIFPLPPFYPESNKNKILILLLSRKAIALKTNAEEAARPIELCKLSGIAEGSMRPTLRALVEERLVEDEDGRYHIFSHALHRYAAILASKDTSDETKTQQAHKAITNLLSMRSIIEDIARQGGLDEGKTARELYGLVLQRRPGTEYNTLYKIILDLVNDQKLAREIQEGVWVYRRAVK